MVLSPIPSDRDVEGNFNGTISDIEGLFHMGFYFLQDGGFLGSFRELEGQSIVALEQELDHFEIGIGSYSKRSGVKVVN